MKIVIIGAAPTGLGAAYRIFEMQNEGNITAKKADIIVLEKEQTPGGLSRTLQDEKGFLWDLGGHITFSHNYPYYENAVQWAVSEWNTLQRNCQVDMCYLYNEEKLHLVPYPAQYAIPLFPDNIKSKCLQDLRDLCAKESQVVPRNFDEWILKHFGPTLRDCFFRQYTQKVWTVHPKMMNPSWVGTRVAKLPQDKLEELCAMDSNELKKVDYGWGPNTVFRFPKYGGTGAVWRAMTEKLPNHWFHFGCEVIHLDVERKRIIYRDSNKKDANSVEIDFDILINTSPIDQLVKYSDLSCELKLLYNSVTVVGVGLMKPIPSHLEHFTWLYFPESTVPFYRVTFLSRYGEMTPNDNLYWSVMCECAKSIDCFESLDDITNRSIDGLIKKLIIKREQIVSVFSMRLPYGYPIPSLNRDAELARAHRILEKNNIYSRGRFGGWKYESSNQDHCFMQGKEIVDRIILGECENVYKSDHIIPQG